MDKSKNSNSWPDQFPESWKEAISRLIDERVEERVKVLEQQFQETISKLSVGGASSATTNKKVPVSKAQSEARNGKLKPQEKDQQEDDKASGQVKRVGGSKINNPSKVRSDSKESSQSKADDKKKAKDEAERKKEEAKQKKEEQERKKKEELEKKKGKDLNAQKSNLGKAGKKGTKDGDDNDDPIEKSLNERIAAGGVTQVVKSSEPAPKGSSKITGKIQPAIEKKIKDKKVEVEEEKGEPLKIETPRNTKAPSKVIEKVEKAVAGKIEKAGGKKGKDDDTDDPIAQAIKLREKFGGVTQVVPAAEAKKMGLIKTIPKEVGAGKDAGGAKDDKADKDKKADPKDKKGKELPDGKKGTTATTTAVNKENQDTENKKAGTNKPTAKPSTTKATNVGAAGKKGKEGEDLDDDPIAKSLKEREKAGGVTQVVSEKGGDKQKDAGGKKSVTAKVATKVAKDVKEEIKKEESKKGDDKKDKKKGVEEKPKDDKKDKKTAVAATAGDKKGKGGEAGGENEDGKKKNGVIEKKAADSSKDKIIQNPSEQQDAKKEEVNNNDINEESASPKNVEEHHNNNNNNDNDNENENKQDEDGGSNRDEKLITEEAQLEETQQEEVLQEEAQQEEIYQQEEALNRYHHHKQQLINEGYVGDQEEEEQVKEKQQEEVQNQEEVVENEEEQHQQENQEENEEVEEEENESEIYYTLKEVQSYLDPENYQHKSKEGFEDLKEKAKELNAQLLEHIAQIEEKISQIKTTSPGAQNQDIDSLKFQIQKRTQQSLDIFRDAPFEVDEWYGEHGNNSWAIRTLKLWFAMHKNVNKLKYVQFPQVLDDDLFCKRAVKTMNADIKDVGEYISTEFVNFEFTNETLFKLHYLVLHIGGNDQINPQSESTDDQLGAFMMFVIKDVLQFLGFFPDKKMNQEVANAWLLKTHLYRQEYLTQKSKQISEFIAQQEE